MRLILIIGMVLIVCTIGVIAAMSGDEAAVDTKVSTDALGHTVVDVSKVTGHVVNRLDSCVDEKYTEKTPVMGTCSYDATECNSDNSSCETVKKEYSCIKDYTSVEKTSKKCNTVGYKIGKNKLNTDEYVCNISDDADSTTVVCDSKYDGNGDGICTSGESCMKFVANGNNMDVYKKNSRDEFVKDDPTYFLNEVSTEVEE